MIQKHRNSIKPTPLLRYSNLSPQSFKDYYTELLDKKFIVEIIDEKKNRYISLTDTGFRYLQKYKAIISLMEEFKL